MWQAPFRNGHSPFVLWISIKGNVCRKAVDVSRSQNAEGKECGLYVGKTSALKFTAAKQL